MGIARKYIIQITEKKSNGVYTTGFTTTYDLTMDFSGVRIDDTTYSHNSISLIELSQLSDADYLQRVEDFLEFVNIDSVEVKQQLLTDSSFDNENC